MKNYGAQRTRIRAMFPDKTEEEIDKIDKAYYLAFPGVKEYHSYCYDIIRFQTYGTNLFGGRYYGVSGHKLINLLIQGSSAYLLKQKIKQIQDYIKEHNLKTRFQMNIHDEMSFETYQGEEQHLLAIRQIMQDYPDTKVPIVAEMEVTFTNWASKKDPGSEEDFLKLYNSGGTKNE